MGKQKEFNYHSKPVLAFIHEHRIIEHEAKGKVNQYLNKYPLEEKHKNTIRNWNGKKQVTLKSLDPLLIRYGLSIGEFEAWCEDQGIDPVANGGPNDYTTADTGLA